MATVEVFRFFSGTNLFSTPIKRFSPQTILPDTPDQLYCDTNATPPDGPLSGMIMLPYLDATTGPIYNGKEVIIVFQLVGFATQLLIRSWDQVGNVILPAYTMNTPGETVSVTAFWDSNTGTGQWLINRLA